MDSNLCYANADTPTPGRTWCSLSDDERLALVNDTVGTKTGLQFALCVALEAKLDGQVIVKPLESVPADRRGTLLLDLEEFLKESIDPGLVVWLEPFGDRSSLRNLHGIKMKS